MHPDQWLVNQRVRAMRAKFPAQSRAAFLDLVQGLFGTHDLSKQQLTVLVKTLSETDEWPDLGGAEATPGNAVPAGPVVNPNPTPDWVLEAVGMLVAVQPGSSVLDLFCGDGTLGQVLPARTLYEGHDNRYDLIMQARRQYPQGEFSTSDITEWMSLEPNTPYGLVFAHPDPDTVRYHENPCLETEQPGTHIHTQDAIIEWGARCCTKGGVLVVFQDLGDAEPHAQLAWLKRHGTLYVNATVGESRLIIYRHGVKLKDHPVEIGHHATPEDLLAAVAAWENQILVPICADDPRPLELKSWDITVEPNPEGAYYRGGDTSEIFKQKTSVGVRWCAPVPAFEWAMHQAFTAPVEESWPKTVNRFNQRLKIDSYLEHRRTTRLHDIINLPYGYRAQEDPALTRYLTKLDRRYGRTLLPYPNKSVLENKYYTLGPGSFLRRPAVNPIPGHTHERWRVVFSEPDFSGNKPPRVHLEREI